MRLRAGNKLVFLGMLLATGSLLNTACAIQNTGQLDGVQIPNAVRPSTQRSSESSNDHLADTPKWIEPKSLIKQLEQLEKHSVTADWATATKQAISELVNNAGIGDPDSRNTFARLYQLLDYSERLMAQVASQNQQHPDLYSLIVHMNRARYAVRRRLSVWESVHELAGIEYGYTSDSADDANRIFSASRSRLSFADVEGGWARYLELDEAESIFNSISQNPVQQKIAARKVLSRVHNPALSLDQRSHMQQIVDPQTSTFLRRAAVEPVQLEEFLKHLEYFESTGSGASEHYLNDHYQSLLWTGDEKYGRVADLLHGHYRNGNFAISVHEQLINNLVPERPDSYEPFQDQILGANVYGQNQISNRIRIALIPDANQISLQLVTDGEVQSNTLAQQSGVTVRNIGNSRFRVMKNLMFGRYGISSGSSQASSETNQRVVDIRSRMDGVPLLGWLTQRVAQRKIQEKAPVTRQYTQRKLEKEATDRFEKEVQENLVQMRQYLNSKVLEPLIAMDLDPEPIETSTSSTHVQMRYRLAGRDQMAANTVRPQELAGSLMSVQMHQSVLNNMLSRLEIAGKKFDPEQFQSHLREVIGIDLFGSAAEIDSKVEFEFAPFDPIRVDFENNQVVFSINLKSLRINNGKRWRKLSIKTRYNPIARGMMFEMTQADSGIELKGRSKKRKLNLGDQIAIRAIFRTLFEEQMTFAAFPDSLAQKLGTGPLMINQLVVSDGWVGISVNDGRVVNLPVTTALEPSKPRTRIGEILKNITNSARR